MHSEFSELFSERLSKAINSFEESPHLFYQLLEDAISIWPDKKNALEKIQSLLERRTPSLSAYEKSENKQPIGILEEIKSFYFQSGYPSQAQEQEPLTNPSLAHKDLYLSNPKSRVWGLNNNLRASLSTEYLDSKNMSLGETNFFIITPSFNSEQYISKTICSVITQASSRFKIFYHIQDGGSSDETISIIKAWSNIIAQLRAISPQFGNFYFSWDSEKDAGMYQAINKGFRGFSMFPRDICAWINSDDVLEPGACSLAYSLFRNNTSLNWIISKQKAISADDSILSSSFVGYPSQIIQSGLCDGKVWPFIQQEGSFWTSALWNKVSGLDDKFKYAGDWDLWRRFAKFSQPLCLDEPLGSFRKHLNQKTSNLAAYYEEISQTIEINPQISFSLPKSIDFNILTYQAENSAHPEFKIKKKNIESSECAARFLEAVKSKGSSGRHSYSSDCLECIRDEIKPLRVATFCTLLNGGAGQGTIRRVEALRQFGVDARIFTLDAGHHKDKSVVYEIYPPIENYSDKTAWQVIEHVRKLTVGSDKRRGEYFSANIGLCKGDNLINILLWADVVHLHWISGFIDIPSFLRLCNTLDLPVFWTTGDMFPVTGGCHYSEGCNQYLSECNTCHQVQSSLSNYIKHTHKKKIRSLELYKPVFICPSTKILDLVAGATQSTRASHVSIPNAYPVNNFRQYANKFDANKSFYINQGTVSHFEVPTFNILLMSTDPAKPRKGGLIAKDLISSLLKLVDTSQIPDIRIVGIGGESLNEQDRVVRIIPSLNFDQLCQYFYTANLFISLSIEDVGPMTVCESLLCGTPVLGFNIGILADMVSSYQITHACRSVHTFTQSALLNTAKDYINDLHVNQLSSIRKECIDLARAYADPYVAAKSHYAQYMSRVANA